MKLDGYQEDSINAVAQKLRTNRTMMYQLATGGGKTVVLSTIADRYTKKTRKKTLILVHREELLSQTVRTLKKWYGITAHEITASTKRIHESDVYVGMCETVFRRKYRLDIGLLMLDEAHLGNYFKLHEMFPDSLIVGFSATPISANKNKPLRDFFEDIICGIDIPELIEINKTNPERGLASNKTYAIKGAVNRGSLHIVRGEFDEKEMGNEFSKSKHVKNTIDAYARYGNGKCIIFNCNISHSQIVTDAFIEAGYNARHIDGTSQERAETFKWFKDTPDAILCNVGIATTGFDEPSILTVIMNRATTSVTTWLQCTGRGARPYPNKQYFTILDLGGNAITHGDWSDKRDWEDIFHNPPKKREKLGVAPVKDCPECDCIIPVQAMICKYCNYEFPAKVESYDTLPIELVLVTKNLDVATLIEQNEDKKEYYTLFKIGNNIATQAKYKIGTPTAEQLEILIQAYQEKAEEWCELRNKKWNVFHKNLTRNHIIKSFA